MSTGIGILAFTERGQQLSARLAEGLRAEDSGLAIVQSVKCEALGQLSDRRSGREIAADWWDKDVIIFIGAAGIAVRLIAPLLTHKAKDPAVLVLDERGQFCISLLSGHLGGANDWTRHVAALLAAHPVITTATDLSHAFAADLFAEANELVITDFSAAKRVSARALWRQKIRIYSELPVSSLQQLPFPEQTEFLPRERIGEADILIGIHMFAQGLAASLPAKKNVGNRCCDPGIGLFLPPRCLWIGVGARKNISESAVSNAVEKGLTQLSLSPYAVAGLASIDLKKDETGILRYAADHALPFRTFGKEALLAVPGSFTESAFVQSVTGVPNVCERAAMKVAGEEARLLLRKQIYDGVTIAVACTAAYCVCPEDEYAEIP